MQSSNDNVFHWESGIENELCNLWLQKFKKYSSDVLFIHLSRLGDYFILDIGSSTILLWLYLE